jgi:hypothetical protein
MSAGVAFSDKSPCREDSLSEMEGSIYLVATPCSSVIPPRNNRVTRSCWTCCLSSVTFAPQAADLRCCGRCKCPVGRELIPSAKSDAFLRRSACVQPQLFLPCSSSFLWWRWHRVHRSTRVYRYPKSFHRHNCKGCKSSGDRDRRLRFRPRRTRRKEGLGRCRRRNRDCRPRRKRPELALGRVGGPTRQVQQMLNESLMPNNTDPKHRTNRVFKSMHKPLTYLGVERTLFYFVCVGAVGAFNLFNSILAGIALFIGGFAFGHWVTNSDSVALQWTFAHNRNAL